MTTIDGSRTTATFWLTDAPNSITEQSKRMPDGAGLGWFSLGDEPVRDRASLAAGDNPDFALHAKVIESHTFVAHLRYASTGKPDVHNAHPFDMKDRLFAHNGVVKALDVLSSWMTELDKAFVEGETDSELVFAYITSEISRQGGDTESGLIAAINRIGANLPLYALNVILAEPNRLFAVRYPATHELWVCDTSTRPANSSVPAWVVASEPLDSGPGWRLLDPGELFVVSNGQARSSFPFAEPVSVLRREDLNMQEVTSQEPHLTARRAWLPWPATAEDTVPVGQ